MTLDEVFGLSTRGREFVELRRRLHAQLAASTPAAPLGRRRDGRRSADVPNDRGR
jgi:hypothetical protein